MGLFPTFVEFASPQDWFVPLDMDENEKGAVKSGSTTCIRCVIPQQRAQHREVQREPQITINDTLAVDAPATKDILYMEPISPGYGDWSNRVTVLGPCKKRC